MGHHRMADVQLVDAGNRRHCFDVVVMQAMAGIDDQTMGHAASDAVPDARQLTGSVFRALGVGIATGVQFDGRRADALGRFDLQRLGIDKQRHFTTDARQPLDRRTNPRFLAGYIQAAFGGQFLAGFRHQANVGRANAFGKRQHLFGHAHLEVHPRLQHLFEDANIAFLDMPAVFAQVHGNAIGTGLLGVQGGLDRVRITGATGLAQGGDVIDVDTEQNARGVSHGESP